MTMQALTAQVQFTSSNLPIIRISTSGDEINRDSKVRAVIETIDNGLDQRNMVTDVANDYRGNCGIKIRGESSAFFDKKSYAIELWDENFEDLDTSILGFPKEEDFILYGPYSDKSLLNNVLAMSVARGMGQYASRTRYVELLIDGDYKGLYVLMEKIKRDKDRVDIAKLRPEDNEGDELTGGYIIRIDKGQYDGWFSKEPHFGNDNRPYYQFYYPSQEDITELQKAYIEEYVHGFEAAANSDTYRNSDGDHYTEYINLRSFVDHFILTELSKNADGYRLSTYFHKQKDSNGGRLFIGPVWDYNLSFANADYCDTEFVGDFLYYDCVGNSPEWWDNFLRDETFTSALRCRYDELRTTVLSVSGLSGLLDSIQLEIFEAQGRNFERWDIMGKYIWPNPDFFAQAQNHFEVMELLRIWLDGRLRWLDENVPGTPVDCGQYDDPDYEVNTTAIFEVNDLKAIEVFPNPAQDRVRLRCKETIKSVELIDISGRPVLSHKPSHRQVDLELNLPAGLYFLEVVCEQKLYRKTLLVQ